MKITYHYRKTFVTACAVLLLGALCCSQRAYGQAAALPEGVSLIPQPVLPAFIAKDANSTQTLVPVTGDPSVTQALRLTTLTATAFSYTTQISVHTSAAVAKGDVLFAKFRMRMVKSVTGMGRTDLVFEHLGEPWTKSAVYSASAGTKWKQFTVPFTAVKDDDAGKAQLNFHLGFPPQTIEIAEVSLVDYGKSVKVADLPATRLTYEGREPDAPWRKTAAARIEKIRKGDLTVRVTDAAGNPVKDAVVSVKMTRHAFAFGCALNADRLLGDGPDSEKYRETFLKLFNKTVLDNALKWPSWEYDRDTALRAVAWINDHHIPLRGHNLVWPSYSYLPRDVGTLNSDPAVLRKRVDDHITDEITALKGKTVEWDVVNEPYENHQIMDALGPGEMAKWFKMVHAIDPRPLLFLNDNGIIENNGEETVHIDSYEAAIKDLQKRGAPIGGIGLEGHFSENLSSMDNLLAGLDRFGKLGVPLEATEFDVDVPDEQLQADYLRDYMTVLFSHPKVIGILMWGFWAGSHWLPESALFRRDWSLKPNGQAWIDLVQHQWWTDVQGQTDGKGRYRTRGFLGDYEIAATKDGKTGKVPATLVHEGTSVTVVLE